MLDERVRSVLRRLEEEDERERAEGLPSSVRSRAVAKTTGVFLYSLCAVQSDCEVLEIGGSRGYSTIWLGAAVRILGGHVTTLEHDPKKIEALQANIDAAGLTEWVDLRAGDAKQTLREIGDIFDVVFLDAEKVDYEELFGLARRLVEPGGLIVADNVLSDVDVLASYSAARQADPSCLSVTVPLDRGLELTSVLTDPLE
ncbi:MAG TPA: class I SAM-dependent methyltransferase [Gaiellaceae bacterium]|jgi:predicted O-methyltransferase YrrM|nr:class I SAM-dependent methyltransferase [Gaiellaceae bacterium]